MGIQKFSATAIYIIKVREKKMGLLAAYIAEKLVMYRNQNL